MRDIESLSCLVRRHRRVENSGGRHPVQTDAADDPSTANHTMMSFDYDSGDMGGDHALEDSYQEAADILDDRMSTPSTGPGGVLTGGISTASPSVTAFMDSAGYFFTDESGDTRIYTQVYDIERVP